MVISLQSACSSLLAHFWLQFAFAGIHICVSLQFATLWLRWSHQRQWRMANICRHSLSVNSHVHSGMAAAVVVLALCRHFVFSLVLSRLSPTNSDLIFGFVVQLLLLLCFRVVVVFSASVSSAHHFTSAFIGHPPTHWLTIVHLCRWLMRTHCPLPTYCCCSALFYTL